MHQLRTLVNFEKKDYYYYSLLAIPVLIVGTKNHITPAHHHILVKERLKTPNLETATYIYMYIVRNSNYYNINYYQSSSTDTYTYMYTYCILDIFSTCV